MKAIILSGGRGKRLKQITDYIPKSLIPLNNVPIIEWQIKYLKKFGINEIIICTGYKTEQIENYLNTKNNFGAKIYFSKEKIPLGTGGAIKLASKFIKEKLFFVMNGDIITNIDLNLLQSKSNVIAAIQLRTKFGILNPAENIVKSFGEKKIIPTLWMNAGIYFLSKSVMKDLPKKGDIEKTLFPQYAKKGKLGLIKFQNVMWHSIDSYKDMEECAHQIRLKKYEKFLSKR